jgi:hypothetical protein
MSVQKLLIGSLVAAVIAVNGLLIPTTVQATTDVLSTSLGNSVLSRWHENAGALASVLTTMGNAALTTGVTDTVTSTITSTLPVSVPTKIPNAISNYFSGTQTVILSGTQTITGTFSVAASDVISLHLSGMGFGEIFKMYQLALLSGKTPDEILALRESGLGWGVISKQLQLPPGNKGNNLGAAVSGRGVASQPISTTLTTDTKQKNKGQTDQSSKSKGPPADKGKPVDVGKPDTSTGNNGKGNDSGGPPGKSKGK